MNKLIITGTEAHFKIPLSSKIQRTYKIPPISTVVGILKNIYGEDINNFKLGYFIKYEDINKEILTIYKEINPNVKKLTDKKRFTKDIMTVENLYNVKLVIYHNINKNIEFNKPLCLGKANYLANIKFEKVDLLNKNGYGIMQYTPIDIGNGMIIRINTITEYNGYKGYYDFKMREVRENLTEFKLNGNYDSEEDMNIYMWNWSDGYAS